MPSNILLICDHNSLYTELSHQLKTENFTVQRVAGIHEAIKELKTGKPDVILLDSSANEVASLELCHAIKAGARSRKYVVVLISARKEGAAEISAFRAGADDFVTKPFDPAALAERIKVRMNQPKDILSFQPEQNGHAMIHIDRESYTVFLDNRPLELSRKEFELLYLLASQPGKIFRREEVFERVWKKDLQENNRTVDVHILRLRKKIGKTLILTQKGVGYRFNLS